MTTLGRDLRPGDRILLDGREVTVTRVERGDYYERGGGYVDAADGLHVHWLGGVHGFRRDEPVPCLAGLALAGASHA